MLILSDVEFDVRSSQIYRETFNQNFIFVNEINLRDCQKTIFYIKKIDYTSKKSLFFMKNRELISNREIENSQISFCNIRNYVYIDFEYNMNYQKL